MPIFRSTFTAPHEQHADREGQPFTVVGVIRTPDENHDAEVLPMYEILFEDGDMIEAWPEEVVDPTADPALFSAIDLVGDQLFLDPEGKRMVVIQAGKADGDVSLMVREIYSDTAVSDDFDVTYPAGQALSAAPPIPPGRRRMTDEEALDQMNECLSAPEWSVSFLEDLRDILRATGRPILPSAIWARH